MLSKTEDDLRKLVEAKLSGVSKQNFQLYHYSVIRKIESVKLWLNYSKEILPDFTNLLGTYSTTQPTPPAPVNIDSTISRLSAYVDAFFMSAKSTLDSFAHEIRELYEMAGHTGDLYFENVINLLNTHHAQTGLNQLFVNENVLNKSWFIELNAYRRASAHESIIPLNLDLKYDLTTQEWKNLILKLPIDPRTRPLVYNAKNFMELGDEIEVSLSKLLMDSYDSIFRDINNNQTKIIL